MKNMTPDEWMMIQQQADVLFKTGMLPESIKTVYQTLGIIMKGWELGFPPMQSFAHINIIHGKPAITPEAMLALIYRKYPKTKIEYVKNDDDSCVIKVYKNGVENQFKFDTEDAAKANLLGQRQWKQYKRAMLRSRCVGEMARALFPECLLGASYTPEELGEEEEDEKDVLANPELYDPNNEEHRKLMRVIFQKYEVTDRESCNQISQFVFNDKTTINNLDEAVKARCEVLVKEG